MAFNLGTFNAADFLRKSVDLELKIEESDQYGEQNRIAGFAPDGDKAGMSPAPRYQPQADTGGHKASDTIDHDDIPF